MIKDRIIVCIASAWNYDPTSKHQIMRILAQHNDIVWINYHGTRRPGINKADVRSAGAALVRVVRGVRRVGPSMVEVTPLVIPGASHPWLSRLNTSMLADQIRRAIGAVRRRRDQPIQVWSFAPDVPDLVGRFGEELFLYYCVDEYRFFDGINAEHIAPAEEKLLQRADVVVATSAPLAAAKRASRPDTQLIRHGVDYDHFASAWRRTQAVPADIATVPHPRFGFFGLIEHWIDVALLAEVARCRPQYSFVLIGECRLDASALRALPNVHLLGRRSYERLPAYCAAFDAALLPFVQSPMTRCVNPIKMREYLAAGLPVVSTPLPEAERYPQVITIADTPAAFAKACDQIIAAGDSIRRERISRTVRNESWESITRSLSDIVMSTLTEKAGRAATSMPVADVPICDGFEPIAVPMPALSMPDVEQTNRNEQASVRTT